ncbi:MAG: protein-methionine-sulfoxide reductase catalytic subunit MsrP, partial [Pseudomonadota bacterium]
MATVSFIDSLATSFNLLPPGLCRIVTAFARLTSDFISGGIMLIRSASDIVSSEITEPSLYRARRHFIQAAGLASIASAFGLAADALSAEAVQNQKIQGIRRSALSTNEPATSFERITQYGNFYEFGPDKESPAKNAHTLRTRPWTLTIEGEVKRTQTFAIEDILKWAPLEERIYRLRCVEGWSMVIPWLGFPLSELIKRAEITGNAKFVEFWSLADPEQMPYVRTPLLEWPYREALRLDEAMHP